VPVDGSCSEYEGDEDNQPAVNDSEIDVDDNACPSDEGEGNIFC